MVSDADLKGADPNDGFDVELIDLSPQSVHVVACFRAKGEYMSSHFFPDQKSDPDLADRSNGFIFTSEPEPLDSARYGEAMRLQHVSKAVCRYFNTGGTWEALALALKALKETITVDGISLADGFVLYDSYLNTDGKFEHIFGKPGTTDRIIWVEGEFVSPSSEHDLTLKAEEDERTGNAEARDFLGLKQAEEGEEEAGPRLPDPLALFDREDHRHSE